MHTFCTPTLVLKYKIPYLNGIYYYTRVQKRIEKGLNTFSYLLNINFL